MFLVNACGYFDATGCGDNIWNYLYKFLIPTLLATGIGLGIVALLVSSISIVTSAGDTKMTEDALEKIKGNFIGIVVLLLAFVIVNVIIQSLTGTTTPNATPISEGL
jgi:hypothetical protein